MWVWVLQQPGNQPLACTLWGLQPSWAQLRPLRGPLMLPRPPAVQRLHPTPGSQTRCWESILLHRFCRLRGVLVEPPYSLSFPHLSGPEGSGPAARKRRNPLLRPPPPILHPRLCSSGQALITSLESDTRFIIKVMRGRERFNKRAAMPRIIHRK